MRGTERSNSISNTHLLWCGPFIVLLVALVGALFWPQFQVAAPPPPTGRPEHVGLMNSFESEVANEPCRWRDPRYVLLHRVPKAAGTAFSNALLRVGRDNGFRVVGLPEYPQAVGETPERIMKQSSAILRQIRKQLHDAGTRSRLVLEGHLFLEDHLPPDAVALGMAREPLARLASGYNYIRLRPQSVAESRDLVRRKGNRTLGECAVDPQCANKNHLRKLCSFHALYYCGHNPDCKVGEDGAATDGTVALAISNIRNQSLLLLIIPSEDLSDGASLLEQMLPTYFPGLTDAIAQVGSQEKGLYDPRGTRKGVKWDPPSDPSELAALNHICRQDRRVYEEIRNQFDSKRRLCDSDATSIVR